MTIYKFSMQAMKPDQPTKEFVVQKHWKALMFAASEPKKIFHFVDLVYNGEDQGSSIDLIQFEQTEITFQTDTPEQHLIVDIGVLNNQAFSTKFKFVGYDCEPGMEHLIKSCQCIYKDNTSLDLVLRERQDMEEPWRVAVTFTMPPIQEHFSFYLLLDDFTDNSNFLKKVDPGVGNGPPKPKGNG